MINLSRLFIGPNYNKNKDFLLKSDYKVKSVIMDPFGSNKMRFHYPPNYNFEIMSINDNEYKIIINRNNNCTDLANSQYFYIEGWQNNLSITCILNYFELDENCINCYLPANYGTLQISNITDKNTRYKVGIVIPTFGRYEYLKSCLESLNNCDLEDCIIIIIDESLTKNVNDDKIKSNEFIKLFNFTVPNIKIYKNSHRNMFDSINIGLDILGQTCEYLMTLDSDTIHKKDFVKIVLNTYNEVNLLYPDKLLVLSGFNTDKHKFIENNNLNYYIKNTIGGCHLCFSSSNYWKYIRYTLISHKWDTNIYNMVNKQNGIIAVTKPSVIEHIGKISSVRVDNIPYDKSIDFIQNNIIKKFYLISEDLILENGQTWIIDIFKKEFIEYSNLLFVEKPEDANVIWIIGSNPEKVKKLKTINLQNKTIITTIHHIDWDKIDTINIDFNEIKDITTKFHVICDKVYYDLIKLTDKSIVISNFWINENIFYNIANKNELRQKYQIPIESYCIGSFQRDTNGKNKCMKPKLSKGPDIFVKIAIDMNKKYNNLLVILTGRRRNYIISELDRNYINYKYYPMTNSTELNELYNCLDLYIVSSRVEGGPRAILECGISKTPIISTNVGIADLILSSESIYDYNNLYSYGNANPNIEYSYNKSDSYSINKYLKTFIKTVFEC